MPTHKKNKLLDFTFEFEALSKCPLCDGGIMIPNGNIRWLDMDFWYVACPQCNLKFMNPRPMQTSYTKFYKELFWQQKVRNLGFYQEGQMWNTKKYKWDNKSAWHAKKGLQTHIEKHRGLRLEIIANTLNVYLKLGKNTSLLEVGAGFGVTLKEINKQYGSSVYAIEPSSEAQKIIKGFGIKLIGEYAEELEQLRKTRQKFDAVIFSHALENTSYPLQVIKWAKDCLATRGIIYVQCSNLFTFDQMNPYHPYIFSEGSLGYLAKKAGLKAERVDKDTTHRMLTMVFKK